MLISLEAGAEDIKAESDEYEIIVEPEAFESVQEALAAQQIENTVAHITMIPDTSVALSGDDAMKMLKLIEMLEDNDDVQEVYTNFDIPEEMMEA